MQSFRTEFELISHGTKVLVEKDIVDLAKKIQAFREGLIDPEKFRSLRLARGVYGQRQQGVQMVRIKIPFGKISSAQLRKIAALSEQYSNGNLHFTTRQDIQLHHISLEHTPEIWAKLEQDEITLREACGNTVRNITSPAESGVWPGEAFDVSAYADAVFRYFLRKPFAQEMGRKIKIAFSNSEADAALTWIHDIGFIATYNESGERGFRVLAGGGLGAQPFTAKLLHTFLPASRLIPFIESVLRIFDRYGERHSRHKARIKYLIHQLGVDAFLQLLDEITPALTVQDYHIAYDEFEKPYVREASPAAVPATPPEGFSAWMRSNVFEQKQQGYYGVYVRVPLGNIHAGTARKLADCIDKYSRSDDARITINQGLLLRYVTLPELPALYTDLLAAGLAKPGFGSAADVTACPGTDTCNLAISNSTHVALALGEVIEDDFPHLLFDRQLDIKISGCMNSCGQHGLAAIGFHGSSFKSGNAVVPALQVLGGGGSTGNGTGRLAEKIIKIPSRRAPDALRKLLNDFESEKQPGETFTAYFHRKGKEYFYQLLKPLADLSNLDDEAFRDWGADEKFQTAIGVGECAGVMIDLVQTLFFEADEKVLSAREALAESRFADSIYFSYSALIHTAKALLLKNGHHVNTHHALIGDFEKQFIETGKISGQGSFSAFILQLNSQPASPGFAARYLEQAAGWIDLLKTHAAAERSTQKASGHE
ncbi:MAG: HEPN domain-containing protein [Bacteroidetes bacterium]|nr:HEPN domain-containing protein [Bacteroidota bacterium]